MNQKTIQWIINGVLILGLAFAVYKGTESSDSEKPKVTAGGNPRPKIDSSAKVVYVNLDTLYENYSYYKDLLKQLTSDFNTKRSSIVARQEQLAKKYDEYQRAAYRMSPEQLKAAEAELMRDDENLKIQLQNAEEQFANNRDNLNKKLYNKLKSFFDEYRSEKGYDYILDGSNGGMVISGKETLDVTWEIIDGLNKKEKK
jgi:Skp family chaperone for outer membrane proteins